MAENSFSRKLPSIPTPRGEGVTPALAKILGPMKTILENLIVDRDKNDLQAIDIESIIEQVQNNIDLGLIDVGTSSDQVPRPLNLVASGDVKNITLTWDAPSYSNHAYTEVYRSTTNDRPTGTRIGTTAGATFVDKTANKNSTYYYWIRFYSSGNVYGPFNADNTAGVSGELAAITTDEFADGTAPVEYLSALPTGTITDGRTVYNYTNNTLNIYDGSSWTTYYEDWQTESLSSLPTANLYAGRHVFNTTDDTFNVYNGTGWITYYGAEHTAGPLLDGNSSASGTITSAAYTDVVTVSQDVTDHNTAQMQVSLWVQATGATATTVDVQLVFDGVAEMTETGITVPATGSDPFLYNRFVTVDLSTATGTKSFDFEAKKPGTQVNYTNLEFSVLSVA